jgi:energy-coupling factor transporter ATP-binding protein EcfA2
VIRITHNNIDKITDGSYGVVFPWSTTGEPFSVDYGDLGEPWYELLFGKGLNNVLTLSRDEALAILRTWFMFLLFRSLAVSKPILAIFGQPGSGKSTTFRKLYALLYGKSRSIGAVTSPDDFDHSVSVDPLVVLDNVDTWERWLPDRLALSASSSDITKRKLYTDSDTIVLKRQALVGLTAHNPRFGREDVTDRLILLTFERFLHFLPEGQIIAEIIEKRNKLWGAIIQDSQRILRTPMPSMNDVPQFRVEDFARIGYWIAKALGYEKLFVTALGKVRMGQKAFNLEEEQMLVTAISSLCSKQKEPAWRSAGNLWSELELVSKDPQAFAKTYRNAVFLGKKLWALQESLNEMFDVKWTFDSNKGSRVWMIGNKGVDSNVLQSN